MQKYNITALLLLVGISATNIYPMLPKASESNQSGRATPGNFVPSPPIAIESPREGRKDSATQDFAQCESAKRFFALHHKLKRQSELNPCRTKKRSGKNPFFKQEKQRETTTIAQTSTLNHKPEPQQQEKRPAKRRRSKRKKTQSHKNTTLRSDETGFLFEFEANLKKPKQQKDRSTKRRSPQSRECRVLNSYKAGLLFDKRGLRALKKTIAKEKQQRSDRKTAAFNGSQ